MTQLTAIAYVSSATRRLVSQELDRLLVDARDFNLSHDVSGALLHHDGSFFQYVEGPVDGVAQVYARIVRSSQHRGLIELVHEAVDQRHFSVWTMGFAQAAASDLQAIAQSDWHVQRAEAEIQTSAASGLQLLMQFWQRSQGLI